MKPFNNHIISILTNVWIVLACFLLMSPQSQAHELEYLVKEEKANLNIGRILKISDPTILPAGAVEGVDFVDRHTAIVELNYDRSDRTDIAGQTWSYTIAYNLVNTTTNVVIDSGVVQLNNTDSKGVYESWGIHENVVDDIQLQITNITSTGTTIPNDIHLALKLQVNRYNKLDETTTPTMALSSTVPNAKGQVDIYWQAMLGAEYYELEWVYWDTTNTVASSNVTSKELFKQGIRIQTNATHYTTDLVYPAGRVYFRVRPVGCFVAGG